VSQENAELVRSIYAVWERGGSAIDMFDQEIEMIESSVVPGATTARGVDAVARYIASFVNYWDGVQIQPEEYIDAGDQIIVVARFVGRGKSSGVDVDRIWAYVWTIRDGKALRMEAYAERGEALRAVGLA
jgi:ketosteroid isomerase-like protein